MEKIEKYVEMLKEEKDDVTRREELLDFIEDNFEDHPEQLVPYADFFAEFLESKRGPTSWHSFYLMRYIASVDVDKVKKYEPIFQAGLEDKSVVKQDNAAFLLGYLGGKKNLELMLKHIQTTKPRDVVAHPERYLQASKGEGADEIFAEIAKREDELKDAGKKRLAKLKKSIGK